MTNLLAVLAGTWMLIWLLFVRRRSRKQILSASRWMLLVWGVLGLIHVVSPIRFWSLHISSGTVVYCALWIGTFIFADNVEFHFFQRQDKSRPIDNTPECGKGLIWTLTFLAAVGAVMVIVIRMRTVSGDDLSSLLGELRASQLGGDDSGFLKTAATTLASAGLPAALCEVCSGVRDRAKFPGLAAIGLAAYLANTVAAAGRPGVVFAILSLFIAALASIRIYGAEKGASRLLLAAGAGLFVASGIYMTVVVYNRTTGWTGGMDNKLALMNRLMDSELDPKFRNSLQGFGKPGDTVIEMFYYLSPQLYGLDYTIHNYRGPFALGGLEVPVVTRRVEQLLGTQILSGVDEADESTYSNIGVSPHFFRTAAHTTFVDFGATFSIPFVFACGVLSRRCRTTALGSRTPYAIAFAAFICSGAAYTIIFSPFSDPSWYFPLLWFLAVPAIDALMRKYHLSLLRPISGESRA